MKFQFVVCSSVRCGKGWQLPEQVWPDHRIVVVRGGSGELRRKGRSRPLRRGDVVFGLPTEEYGLFQDPRRPLVISVARFHALSARGKRISLEEFREHFCSTLEAFPLLEQIMMRLSRSVPGQLRMAESLLRSILWLIREDSSSGAPAGTVALGRQELKPALEYQPKPGQFEPEIAELARLCGMSLSTFRRRFQECFNRSPKQIFVQRRMERAKNLLLQSHYSTEAIATELGYCDATYFCRQFRQHVGMSPAAFRTSHR